MIARLLILLVALASFSRLQASDQPTRIVEYLYDGDGVKKRVSITSFSGGPAVATFTTSGKKPSTAEIDADAFKRIWEAFTSLDQLKRAEIQPPQPTLTIRPFSIMITPLQPPSAALGERG